jgi:predicted nucleic acid-binding protein
VDNASPLIILGKIAQIPLLANLAQTLVIPAGVASEIDAGAETDPARQWLSGRGRTYVQETGPLEPVLAGWDLGSGESEVLSWALKHPDFEVIVDYLASRKCAAALRIPVRGTLGVLLLARKEGHLADFDSVLAQVQEAGLHIATEILEALRRLA